MSDEIEHAEPTDQAKRIEAQSSTST